MALGYSDVRHLYDTLKDAGVVTQSLHDWSAGMNRETGSDAYSAGLEDSWIKAASSAVDDALEYTGLPQLGEMAGRTLGGAVGMPEEGAELGHGWARGAVNMLPLLIPGAGWLGAAGMGAMSAADAYTQSGSKAAAIASGLTAGLMPRAAHLAEQAVLKGLQGTAGRIAGEYLPSAAERVALAAGEGAGIVPSISKYVPQTIAQGIASQAAGQGAAALMGETGRVATQIMAGEQPTFSPTDALLNMTLGQLPFGILYAGKGGRTALGGEASRRYAQQLRSDIEKTQGAIKTRQAIDESDKRADWEKVSDPSVPPTPMTPADDAAKQEALNKLRGVNADLQKEGTPSSMDDLKVPSEIEGELISEKPVAKEGQVMGVQEMPDDPRMGLIGTEIKYVPDRPAMKKGPYRVIRVSDDPANGEYAGKVIRYSAKFEPQPTNIEGAVHQFQVPKTRFTVLPERAPGAGSVKPPAGAEEAAVAAEAQGSPETVAQGAVDKATGKTPIQKTDSKAVDVEQLAKDIDTKVSMAKSPADLEQVGNDTNALRDEYDLPHKSDSDVQHYPSGNAKDQWQAAVNETTRQVEATESADKVGSLRDQKDVLERQLAAAHDAGDETAAAITQQKLDALNTGIRDEGHVVEQNAAHMGHIYDTANGDVPEATQDQVAKAQEIKKLRDDFSRSRDRRLDMVTQGVFDRMVKEWDGVDILKLKADINNVVKTGKGMRRAPVGKRGKAAPIGEVAKPGGIKEGEEAVAETLPEEPAAPEVEAGLVPETGAETAAEAVAAPATPHVEQVELPRVMRLAGAAEEGTLMDLQYLRQTHKNDAVFAKEALKLVDNPGVAGEFERLGINMDQLDTELASMSKNGQAESMRHPGKDLEGVVPNGNDPRTKPLNQIAAEIALQVIPPNTKFTVDKTRLIDLINLGKERFMEKYGFDEGIYNEWAGRPNVKDWMTATALEVQKLREAGFEKAEFGARRQDGLKRLFETLRTGLDEDFSKKVGRTGEDVFNHLLTSEDPAIAAFAKDLEPYRAAMRRVDTAVGGRSAAVINPEDPTRVSMVLRRSLRDAVDRDQTMMHELLHGLTLHELQRDPVAKARVQGLMDKFYSHLPKNLQAVVDDMRETGWYEGHMMNIRDFREYKDRMTDYSKDVPTLYALMNPDEFVSEGLTSGHLREQLSKIPGVLPKESLWQSFKRFIAETFGLSPKSQTLLDDLMSVTDRMIANRNKEAMFREYGQRYFESMGYKPNVAEVQVDKAYNLGNTLEPWGAIIRHMTLPSMDPTVQGAEQALSKWAGLNRGKETATSLALEEHKEATGYAGSTVGKLDTLVPQLMRDGKMEQLGDLLGVLDPEAANYVYAKWRELDGMLGMLEGATSEEVRPFTGTNPEVRGNIEFMAGMADKIRAFEERQIEAEVNMHALSAFDPLTGARGAASTMDETGTPDPFASKKPGVISRFFRAWQNPISLAKSDPLAAESVVKGLMLESNAHSMTLKALEPLGFVLQKGRHVIEDVFSQVMRNRQVEGAVSKWAYLNNKLGAKDGIVHLTPDHPEVAKILGGLSPDNRAKAITVMNGVQQSIQIKDQQILNGMKNEFIARGNAILAKVPNIKDTGLSQYEARTAISQGMLEVMGMDWANPQVAPVAEAQLNAIMAKINDWGTSNRLLQYMQNRAEVLKSQQEFFAKNPAWMTAQRHGAINFEYMKGGELVKDSANSKSEAIAKAGGKANIKNFEYAEPIERYALKSSTPEAAARLEQLEQNMHDILRPVLGDEAIAQMQKYSPTEAWKLELAYQQGVKNLQTQARTLGKGAEHISWLQNHIEYLSGSSQALARKQYIAENEALMQDPRFEGREDLVNQLKAHQNSMLTPDPWLGKSARKYLSTWFLVGNLGTALVNASQIPIRGTSEMMALNGKFVDSWRRMINATREAVSMDTLLHRGAEATSADRQWLYNKMRESKINSVWSEETGLNEDSPIERYRDALAGRYDRSKPEQAWKAGQWLANLGMMPFRFVEKINQQTAILAGFDYWRERLKTENPGLKDREVWDRAYVKAMEFNTAVNDAGGKANRAIGVFDRKDDLSRNAVMAMTSLQTYTIGTTNQLVGFIKKGFFKPAGTKTPAESYNNRMAAIHMLVAQAAAGGVLGLPFMSGALAGINQLFPDLEVNKHVREWMNELLGGDAEHPNALADMAMMGIPSMLGWDWQSRLSMGNFSQLAGVSEYNGFQPGNLLGPAYTLGSKILKGGQGIVHGDVGAITNFFPPIAKKWADLAANGMVVRDNNDKPMYNMTPGEAVGTMLGFQPTRLAKENTARRIVSQARDQRKKADDAFHAQLANEMIKGNVENVRMRLIQKQKENPGQYDPVDGARTVARMASDLTFPRDLRREGGPETGRILTMYGVPSRGPSEAQRVQFQENALRRLGVNVSRSSMQKAMIMDQLAVQYPNASRYELQRAAERMQGKQPATLAGGYEAAQPD